MKRKLLLKILAAVALATGCTQAQTPELEELAYKRLPKAVDKAMVEELSISGGAEIVSPVTLYSCDSLCIIQLTVSAKNPEYAGYRFPARYAFVKDMVMSYAYGTAIYSEKITGSPDLSEKKIEEIKEQFKRDADKLYVYYSAVATSVHIEDL